MTKASKHKPNDSDGILEEFEVRNEFGKTNFETACALGQLQIVKQLCDALLSSDANFLAVINQSTEKGYTALHHAAAWGHLEVIKLLLDLGANCKATTIFGETPNDLAKKYKRTHCTAIFDVAEIRRNIIEMLITVKDNIVNPKKLKTIKYKPSALNEINLSLEKLDNMYDYDELIAFHQEVKEMIDSMIEFS